MTVCRRTSRERSAGVVLDLFGEVPAQRPAHAELPATLGNGQPLGRQILDRWFPRAVAISEGPAHHSHLSSAGQLINKK